MPTITPTDFSGFEIQNAINKLPSSGGVVSLKPGTYKLWDPVILRSNVTLQGAGFATQITSFQKMGIGSALLQSEDPNHRYYGIFIRDLSIDNHNSERGIGIDFQQVSNGGIENVKIDNVRTGVRVKGAAFYNSFSNLIISNASVGMEFTPISVGENASSPNENRIFGARLVEVKVGFDLETNNVHFFQCSVEGTKLRPFQIGYRLRPWSDNRKYTSGIGIYGARFENSHPLSGKDIGIEIGSGVTRTSVIAPYFASVSKPISDNGSVDTVVFGDGKLVLTSPNRKQWEVRVEDDGSLRTKAYNSD